MKPLPPWLRILLLTLTIPTGLGILGVVAGIIALRGPQQAPAAQTKTWVRVIRAAAQNWQASTSTRACPTVRQLVNEKHLDPGLSELDVWGRPFVIECLTDEIVVTSSGPDKKLGTADDIRVPPPY